MKKYILVSAIVAVVVGAGSFYGGMLYGTSASPKSAQARTFGNMQGQRGQGMQGAPGERNMGGITNGQVLSKDANSLIVKLRDGGSKIVFYSASTTVSTMATGTMDDVSQGTDVMIMGAPNADGSLTAQTVQLRPSGDAFQPPTTR